MLIEFDPACAAQGLLSGGIVGLGMGWAGGVGGSVFVVGGLGGWVGWDGGVGWAGVGSGGISNYIFRHQSGSHLRCMDWNYVNLDVFLRVLVHIFVI